MAAAFEHRFEGGELDGHALGNLLLVGLAETIGDFAAALDEAGRLLGAVGRVLPATTEPVVLKAEVEGEAVEGQVAVANSSGDPHGRARARRRAGPARRDRGIAAADQVVLAPGSLYTSLLAGPVRAGVRAAVRRRRRGSCRSRTSAPSFPRRAGSTARTTWVAVLEHGARVDVLLYEPADGACRSTAERSPALGVEPVGAAVRGADGLVHDPANWRRRSAALL